MKLVEIQPSSLLTTLSVLSRRSLISFCWFSGSTVKTLIRVVTSLVTAIVVFMMFSSKKYCALSLHHEDDAVNQNGSVGRKKDVERSRRGTSDIVQMGFTSISGRPSLARFRLF